MSLSDTAIINNVPAANSLRKVPGFNPLSYLRQCVSQKTGQPVLRRDLTHKKLWFRLAFPNGRMVLNPLRITDQLAIFEAQIYLSKDDKDPFSRFTSSVSLSEAGNSNYVKAALESALNEALESAGFGIQLCDVAEVEGSSDYGSEIPADAAEQAMATAKASPAANAPSIAGNAPSAPIAQAAPIEQGTPIERATSLGVAPSAAPSVRATQSMQSAPAVAPAPSTQTAPAAQVAPVAPSAPIAQAAPVVNPEAVQAAQAITEAPIAPVTTENTLPAQSAQEQDAVTTMNAQGMQIPPESAAAALESVTAPNAGEPNAIPEAPAQAPAQQNAGAQGEGAAPTPPVQQTSSLEQLLANTQPRVISFPSQAPAAVGASDQQNVEAGPEVPENTAQPLAGYTPDMSVEDIMARMTLEEANAVVVTTGTCKGWTLAQVAQSRAPSLKFYVCSGNSDNVLKAASKIVLEDLSLKKAG